MEVTLLQANRLFSYQFTRVTIVPRPRNATFAVSGLSYLSSTLWKFCENFHVCPFLKISPLILKSPLAFMLSLPLPLLVKFLQEVYICHLNVLISHSFIKHCNLICFPINPSCQIQWTLFSYFALASLWHLKIRMTCNSCHLGAPLPS